MKVSIHEIITKKPFSKQEMETLAKSKWCIQGFNACANYISLAGMSGIYGCNAILGYGYTKILLAFKNDYVEFHYLEDDFKNIGEEFIRKFKNNKAYFKSLLGKDKELHEHSLYEYQQIKKKIDKHITGTSMSTKMSTKEIISLHLKTYDAYHSAISVGHVIEGITYVLEKEILTALQSELTIGVKEAAKIMNERTQPVRPSFITQQEIDLLQILKVMKRNNLCNPKRAYVKLPQSIKKIIINHAEKYFYYQLNYFHAESLKPEDYFKLLLNYITDNVDPDKQIDIELNRYKQNINNRKAGLKKLKLREETIELLTLSVEILHWQDDRKMYILMGDSCMHKTLSLIAQTFKIDLDLLKMLHPSEITLKLFDSKKELIEQLKKRTRHFILYHWYENKKMYTKIFTEQEYTWFIEASKKHDQQIEDLHGLSASNGKVIGKVRICRNKDDITKFKEGEILVAPMTRPEYVPAMKKAAAIVTDEGGITCHAAIISRELNIPCVIGTKIATKILKDGMNVEVRANHGLVKVLD